MDKQQGDLRIFQVGSHSEMLAADSAYMAQQASQEADLVYKAQLGNHTAFNSLFHNYNQQISKYLFRLVNNVEVACDLAQDTFLAAWQALPLMPAHALFRPWLYKIATHKAISWWRRSKHINWVSWEEQESEQHSSLNNSFSTSGFEEQVDMTDLIQAALRTLPGDQRVCLLLQSVGGFKIHEIAQMLNMNPKTVSVYISRAREHFRQTYAHLQSDTPRTTKGDQS